MQPTILNEVTRYVRSNTSALLDTADALRFLIGDGLDAHVRRDLKVINLPWG